MNRLVAFAFTISLLIHIALLGTLNYLSNEQSNDLKTSFSKEKGEGTIRAILTSSKHREKQNKIRKNKPAQEETTKQIHKPSTNSQSKMTTGQDSIIAAYLSKVREQIVLNKYKSRIARKLKMNGKVKLKFEVSYPNTFSGLEILESSGIQGLDDSALKSIGKITNFPIMPKELLSTIIPVQIELIYE